MSTDNKKKMIDFWCKETGKSELPGFADLL